MILNINLSLSDQQLAVCSNPAQLIKPLLSAVITLQNILSQLSFLLSLHLNLTY